MRIVSLSLLCICILLLGCQKHSEMKVLQGEIFGSSYLVKYIGNLDTNKFSPELAKFFKDFNTEFSTYQSDSVISQFNRLEKNKKLKVSTDFISLLKIAQKLHQDTEGAFDPTLGPVIKIWGFGGAKKRTQAPESKKIQSALKNVGFTYLVWDELTSEVWKTKDSIQLDVNAFAPGFAADMIAKKLESHGIFNYMVDIGGEFTVKGKKNNGESWVIGIEKPDPENKTIQVAIRLEDESLATSGNYRQFFNEGGQRRSHIIDPRTGYPVDNVIASATVIASSAALADGWGTAMMILGEKGIDLAQRSGIKVFLLSAQSDKEFREITSEDFKKYLLLKR